MVANKQSPSGTVVLEEPGMSDPMEEPEDADFNRAAANQLDEDGAQATDVTEAAARERIAAEEEAQFREAEYQIRQAIQDIPGIQQLAQNLITDRPQEGLRIQIVDPREDARR